MRKPLFLLCLLLLCLGIRAQSPFDPKPLTPAQQAQVDERKQAAAQLVFVDQIIAMAAREEQALTAEWTQAVVISQAPLAPFDQQNVTRLLDLSARTYHERDVLRNLRSYRGAVTGWAAGIGQPNHPEMPAFNVQI
ncbi:MAG TPA: hypothetical protein VNH41_10370 [Steroidobacteraceae bacterium]|nr:hypothetical protein [Steroidobacteraceae bacterium]